MRFDLSQGPRPHGTLSRILLTLGALAVLGVAIVLGVVVVGVLLVAAIAWLIWFRWRIYRMRKQAAQSSTTGDARIIEGEYVVVQEERDTTPPR